MVQGDRHLAAPPHQGPEAISGHFKAMESMARGNRHLTANLIIDVGDAIDTASGVTKVARASSYRLLHKVSERFCVLCAMPCAM